MVESPLKLQQTEPAATAPSISFSPEREQALSSPLLCSSTGEVTKPSFLQDDVN